MDEHTLRMMQLASQGYVCSQIIVKMALELRNESNPALVRAMAGPGYGCGGVGTCGALVGGCCLLGLYLAKGADDERTSEYMPLMINELTDWFAQKIGSQYGGITCEAIVGEDDPAASMSTCGAIVADTYAKAMEILTAGGIDPMQG